MQNIFLLIRQKCSKINGAHLRPGGLLYYGLCHSNNIFRAKIVWWFYFIEISICCFCQPLHLLTLDIFANFGYFCQHFCHLLHPPNLLFWPKSASLFVYSVVPYYSKLESNELVGNKTWVSTEEKSGNEWCQDCSN